MTLAWIIALVVLAVGFVAFTGAPYVPSQPRQVRRALTELYPLGKTDVLVDIGSGDGVVLREASKQGARAIGYELHPVLVLISRLWSRHDKNVSVKLANFWRISLPDDVTVVYTFGDGRDITKMYYYVAKEAARLARPIAFISYAFEVPGVSVEKTVGAHHLYNVAPLQSDGSSV